jgi:nucleotide-binding universal stress UspA family protein
MNFKKILWATDLSQNAAKALPLVTSLSEKFQTEVHVLYVLAEVGHFGAWYGDFDRSVMEEMQAMEMKEAEARLDEICQQHLEGCPLYIRHTAIGDPASEILKLIDKEKPDLVAITSLGRGGRFHFGGVAEKVIKHSPIPVLTVPVRML